MEATEGDPGEVSCICICVIWVTDGRCGNMTCAIYIQIHFYIHLYNQPYINIYINIYVNIYIHLYITSTLHLHNIAFAYTLHLEIDGAYSRSIERHFLVFVLYIFYLNLPTSSSNERRLSYPLYVIFVIFIHRIFKCASICSLPYIPVSSSKRSFVRSFVLHTFGCPFCKRV